METLSIVPELETPIARAERDGERRILAPKLPPIFVFLDEFDTGTNIGYYLGFHIGYYFGLLVTNLNGAKKYFHHTK